MVSLRSYIPRATDFWARIFPLFLIHNFRPGRIYGRFSVFYAEWGSSPCAALRRPLFVQDPGGEGYDISGPPTLSIVSMI